ncbi:MAG TPA: ABC transporter ATP-binding protein [Galbitalea sp.]|jgi:ABC-type dipeptide/oligopeptide/nickel transport system ATPase component
MAEPHASGALVVARDLTISGPEGDLVHGISFALERGGALGIVGESGSGKSLTCRSLLGILPPGVAVTGGSIELDERDVTNLSYRDWQGIRGTEIGAVFQDPGSYLNPGIPVGKQLTEVLRVKLGMSRREVSAKAIESLGALGLRAPEIVSLQYPHELSGGMLQRVLIAIALAESPRVLIADEPTTALDVTVQAEVLDVLADLRERLDLAVILVSHDLAVVAQVCTEIVVLKDGMIVEAGPTARVLGDPQHEYTRLLVDNHARYGIERYLSPELADA